ncbi:hypothetical protein J7L27_06340 [Candidatus Bathyarchaeota archaeon]|nr:hypothetical protein [Candidatus Bathyarchaeota archaeon]
MIKREGIEGIEEIIKIFNQAWMEMHCPFVTLKIVDKDDSKSSNILSIENGEVYIKPDTVPKGCDPRKYLLWFFRHELAHVHHCPYDLRTAYSLEKAAYEVVGNWDLAYLATHLFADLQINVNYLPRRFGEIPYFMRILRSRRLSFLEQLLQEVYLLINPISKSRNKNLQDAAKEILAVMLLDKPWHSKVRILAIILDKLRTLYPRAFSEKKIEKYVRENVLRVREDFLPNSLRMFEEIFGGISNAPDAEKFFKQWIEPRLSPEEKERMKKMIEERAKMHKAKGKGKGKRIRMLKEGDKSIKEKVSERGLKKPVGEGLEEPSLPTSLSTIYGKIPKEVFNEAFWKKFWYRSRAEKVIMHYLSENPSKKPVWAVVKYPDDWYIEDEIEDLDIDISLDEGPLIPEVTTLKWVEEPMSHGQSLVTGFVPSEITVLDASLSMSKIHDDAATAAFIAYLSAKKAGGETAVITFSTQFFSADWDSSEDLKELVLSMNFEGYTIFPAYEIERMVSERVGNSFIIIITDGGWQNINEAIPILEKIADSGHKIVIFLLPGGEYPEKIALLKKNPHLSMYEVKKPEVELQNLVLSQAVKTYRAFLP